MASPYSRVLILLGILPHVALSQSSWTLVSESWRGNVFGVDIDASTGMVAVAAGVQEKGGSGVWLAQLPNLNNSSWSFSTVDFMFITSAVFTPVASRIVAMGVDTSRSRPTAWLSDDQGESFFPSDSTNAALSGQDLKLSSWSADGQNLLATVEFNAWSNGTACSTDASPQCSGVAITQNGGLNWTFALWGGTDAPGIDARYSSSPSEGTIFVAGGSWPASAQSAATARRQRPVEDGEDDFYSQGFRGVITKSTDGGETFTTIINQTGFDYGYFNDIGCAGSTCYAISECTDTECTKYGFHVWKTIDSGESWSEAYFGYEESALVMRVVSESEVWLGGGSVGLSATSGFVFHTTDGGATWDRETVKGGYVFGLDVHVSSGLVVASVENILTSNAQIMLRVLS